MPTFIGSPDIWTRNSRSPRDADRHNYGKRLWVDDSRGATAEINAEPQTVERLRRSRQEAREGLVTWRDESPTA